MNIFYFNDFESNLLKKHKILGSDLRLAEKYLRNNKEQKIVIAYPLPWEIKGGNLIEGAWIERSILKKLVRYYERALLLHNENKEKVELFRIESFLKNKARKSKEPGLAAYIIKKEMPEVLDLLVKLEATDRYKQKIAPFIINSFTCELSKAALEEIKIRSLCYYHSVGQSDNGYKKCNVDQTFKANDSKNEINKILQEEVNLLKKDNEYLLEMLHDSQEQIESLYLSEKLIYDQNNKISSPQFDAKIESKLKNKNDDVVDDQLIKMQLKRLQNELQIQAIELGEYKRESRLVTKLIDEFLRLADKSN